jgi:hypothetical protein
MCARITAISTGTVIADLVGLVYDLTTEAARPRFTAAPRRTWSQSSALVRGWCPQGGVNAEGSSALRTPFPPRRGSVTLGREVATMTEAEWLEATDTTLMLAFIGDSVSDRTLPLFASACPGVFPQERRFGENAFADPDGCPCCGSCLPLFK